MIFVVEDDPNIRELVTYTLQSTGFDACGFENGSEFLKALSDGEKPELVLLDIMLPGEDGISILGKLRKKSATKDLPIIMMTAKGTEYDKVLGLDSGADDYITKPFGMMEPGKYSSGNRYGSFGKCTPLVAFPTRSPYRRIRWIDETLPRLKCNLVKAQFDKTLTERDSPVHYKIHASVDK